MHMRKLKHLIICIHHNVSDFNASYFYYFRHASLLNCVQGTWKLGKSNAILQVISEWISYPSKEFVLKKQSSLTTSSEYS